MAVSTPSYSVDPRVEFWSDQTRWPRNCTTHVFLGWVFLDLGSIVYKAWTGKEPTTAIVHPLWPTLDANTPQGDIRRAVDILLYIHEGYARRAEAALNAGQGMPMPTPDEWAVASGWWRQVADESQAAYNRFLGVVDILVSIFELNFVATAVRGNLAGEMRPVPAGWWINECFEHWFATCQIDPNFPFMRSPVRFGGDWIYVERDSYFAWRNAAFRALIEEREKAPQASATSDSSGDDDPAKDAASQPAEAGADAESSSSVSGSASCDDAIDKRQLDLFSEAASREPATALTTSGSSVTQPAVEAQHSDETTAPPVSSVDGHSSQRLLTSEQTEQPQPVNQSVSLDEVATPERQQRKKQKTGNKPTYDWPSFVDELLKRLNATPKPRSVRALASAMLEWCNDVWGREPSESRVRTIIAETLATHNITLD